MGRLWVRSSRRESTCESRSFSKPVVVLSPRSQSFRVSRCLRSLPELSSGRSLAFGETGEVESVVKCSHLIKKREGKLLQLNLLCLLVFPHCALTCSDLWWYREVNFRVRTKKVYDNRQTKSEPWKIIKLSSEKNRKSFLIECPPPASMHEDRNQDSQ